MLLPHEPVGPRATRTEAEGRAAYAAMVAFGERLAAQGKLKAVESLRRKAAAELGIAPSAVSHAISSLEESLNLRLMARTTRSAAPTAEGRQLLETLQPALADQVAADPRVTFVHQPTSNFMENWLNGLTLATGTYCNFLMDDDLFHPRKVERMVHCCETMPSVGLVTSFRELIDGEGKPVGATTNVEYVRRLE